MIDDLPTSNDFRIIAEDCLNQSFEIIFNLVDMINELKDESIIESGEEKNYFHNYNNYGILRTAIILNFQAIEYFMKSEVAKISPLLLIAGNRKNWVEKNGEIKSFSDFNIIGAEELLFTYISVSSKVLEKDLKIFIGNIREQRNKLVHNISKEEFKLEKILENIIETFILFVGKDFWIESINNYLENNLLSYVGAYEDVFLFLLNKRIKLIENNINHNEKNIKLKEYFGLEIETVRYFCTTCKDNFDYANKEIDSKWCILDPNNSNSITCLICKNKSVIKNRKCKYYNRKKAPCKSNVISKEYNLCLTCLREQ